MKLDLHVHTKHSKDCGTEPSAVVDYALKLGLDGIAVTDHDTIQGGMAARKLAPPDFHVIVGSEIKTDQGEVIGYFLNQEVEARPFHDVIDAIHAQGGIAVVSHPYDPFRPNSLYPRNEDSDFLDGVEVLNSRCVLSRATKKARAYARDHALLVTAGSDAHTPGEVGAAGVVVEDIEDIRHNKAGIFGGPTPLTRLFKARLTRFL